MVVKTGYKQTELGMIPEDWDAPLLGDLFTFKNGLNKAKEFFGYGTPIVNYMDVFKERGLFAADLRGRVSLSSQELRTFEVRKGDVFFTRTSETAAEVGMTSVMLDTPENTVFSGFILRARPKDDSLDDQFKKYCFSTDLTRKQITSQTTETTRALTNGRYLSAVAIARPPLREQRAVANALSDVDYLIAKLDQLISKKRDLKQAAMQQLLTSMKRLPGFTGSWEVTNLGKVAEFARGRGLSKADLSEEGTYKCIHYGQLFTTYKELIREVCSRTNISEGCFYSRENDVLMPTSDVTPSGLATASCIKENGVILGGGVLVIRLHTGYDGLYFSYFVTQNRTSILKLVKGSTVFHLYASDLVMLEVCFPEHQEQTAIAQVLSDMDAEIEALEHELAKFKMIKQGMMQELLAGKTRLIGD